MNPSFVQLVEKPSTLSSRYFWPDSLSEHELRLLGWKPLPITEFVIKIHSRCNLACDYCYMYELADTSWRSQATMMSTDIARRAAERIAEHAEREQLDSVSIVLHGGEPLLVGKKRLYDLLDTFSSALESRTRVYFSIQTNGILLTDSVLSVLNAFDVHVGISLDGGREAHDRHRKRPNGVGTYAAVAERIVALQSGPFAYLFNGLLATIDLDNDPVEVYEDLRAFDPPRIDFLLPLGNWTTPPPRLDVAGVDTPYGNWLVAVFDHWFDSARREPMVRLFREIIRVLHGQNSTTEAIGSAPVSLATITTDGAYELADNLKSTFDGATNTGFNVFDHDLGMVQHHPSTAVRQIAKGALCDTCLDCSIGDVCAGGQYAHRYREADGFRNPSVYCRDLYRLVDHVQRTVEAQGQS